MQPVYIQHIASIHAEGSLSDLSNLGTPNLPYLKACEPDYKSIITNATLRRRMSRIIKMGVACGLECINDLPAEKVGGIITAPGLGCLADTEKFINSLIDHEERMLNPTPFIQSTFNTIGAQIALLRRIHAYNMTYVHRGLSFESALIDAIISVWEGKDNILVGAIDEITETSYVIQQRLGLLKSIQAGEGAQFFLLSRTANEQTLGEINGVETRVGEYSAQEIGDWITAFIQKSEVESREITQFVAGNSGSTIQDIARSVPTAIHQTFKDQCGEYPTASSYALWKTIQDLQSSTQSEIVLIYNCYQSINHSLILIRKEV